MKRATSLGLLAALVLTLGAFGGVASATPAKLTAEQYPASLSGETEGFHQLVTAIGSVNCETSFTGEVTQKTAAFPAALSGTCYPFGSPSEIKMNGCQFEFNPYWETYAIGPKGCGPITIQLGTCTVSLPAQTNLAATYKTVEGTPDKLKVTSTATNLTYSTAKNYCYGENNVTSERGELLGSWLVSATDSQGKADGLSLISGVYEYIYEAESYPVTLNGTQEAGNPHSITMEAGKVNCKVVAGTGTLTEGSPVTLTPSYSECEGFGFSSATVATNGCSYIYEGTLNDSMSISCPEGKAIVVTAAACSVEIPAQSELNSISHGNTVVSGHKAISITSNLSGMSYTVTKDGFLCPFEGTGARTDGSYGGGTLVQGKDSEGGLVNVRVNGA